MVTTINSGPLRATSPNQMNSPCASSANGVSAGLDSFAPQNGILAAQAPPASEASRIAMPMGQTRRM